MAERGEVGPILNGIPSQLPDIDPDETQEWLDSLDGVVDERGRTRARYVMLKLNQRARERQVGVPSLTATDYVNTIPPEDEPWFPGDEEVERRYRAWLRWNAAIMVHRAQRPGIGVGGHISSYASSATTTSSRARTPRAAATRSTSRATPPPASTPGPTSRAG